MSADELKAWISLIAANPAILLVGYFVIREMRRVHDALVNQLGAMHADVHTMMRRLGIPTDTRKEHEL